MSMCTSAPTRTAVQAEGLASLATARNSRPGCSQSAGSVATMAVSDRRGPSDSLAGRALLPATATLPSSVLTCMVCFESRTAVTADGVNANTARAARLPTMCRLNATSSLPVMVLPCGGTRWVCASCRLLNARSGVAPEPPSPPPSPVPPPSPAPPPPSPAPPPLSMPLPPPATASVPPPEPPPPQAARAAAMISAAKQCLSERMRRSCGTRWGSAEQDRTANAQDPCAPTNGRPALIHAHQRR